METFGPLAPFAKSGASWVSDRGTGTWIPDASLDVNFFLKYTTASRNSGEVFICSLNLTAGFFLISKFQGLSSKTYGQAGETVWHVTGKAGLFDLGPISSPLSSLEQGFLFWNG